MNINSQNHEIIISNKIVKTVLDSFSLSILNDYNFKNGDLFIELKYIKEQGTYFTTGDKVNKLKSIESIRIMSKHIEIKTLNLSYIDNNFNKSTLKFDRKELNNYLNLDISSMDWDNDFLQNYDNQIGRKLIVEYFEIINN